ncbi:YegP family protein [Pseudomonas sp. Irchel s3b2]|uniref:YegP family protein n=1 Tax=Pseudomonas sp. Irchel s3b2 TaxID=2009073 RepID=UPI000BA38184|nr:YegP family protein [Pseudomonas sp. Irchel s3b2]
MSGWYEVSKTSNGQFKFVLKAANAETILTSELYTSRGAADGGIASVQANSPLDERYEKKTTKDGHPYFNLKAGNHEIIGSSESYSTDAARDKGIASVKANGPTTVIKDKTLPVL